MNLFSKIPRRTLTTILLSLTLLAACSFDRSKPKDGEIAENQVDNKRLETSFTSDAPDADVVKLSLVRIYAPLPESIGTHPEACDWLNYLRFRHVDGPKSAPQADAVVIGMPGLIGGAALYDQLARNTIKQLASQGKFAEFWAIDRRANCVEDLTGIKAATKAQDYRIAFEYYYKGRKVEGKKFGGFLKGGDVPFLADFGLRRTVEDLYTVMLQEMPNLADRQQKLFCGGHSMGGPIMAGFTTWDFDGDANTLDDAGYNQCHGFFALDTSFLEIGSRLEPIIDSLLGPLTGLSYKTAVSAIRGSNFTFLEIPAALDIPKIATLFVTSGLAAYSKPDEETELFALLPDTSGVTLPLRLLFSSDLLSFIKGEPKLSDFRMTNEAALGTLFDDNSNPLFVLQGSLGTFDGGPVVQKRFPFPANDLISVLPGIGQRASALFGGQLMMPAEPHGPLYRWRAYDRIDEPGAPVQLNSLGQAYTNPATEVTDIRQFARSLHELPVDAFEAYFPTRLLLDTFFFFQVGIRSGDLAGSIHSQDFTTPSSRPFLSMQAGDGFATTKDAAGASEFIIPGYNHLDVATGAESQNTIKNELVSNKLIQFIINNISP